MTWPAPALVDVTWRIVARPDTEQTTRVHLAHARSKGIPDEQAIPRILAVASPYYLLPADVVVTAVADVDAAQ